MNRPVISIYFSVSAMHNLTIKYCAIMLFTADSGKIYTKIINEALINSTGYRAKLYAIIQTLNAIKVPSIVNIYLQKDRDVIKYNEHINSKNIEKFVSTRDLWHKIFSLSNIHEIKFLKAEENNQYIQECNKELERPSDIVFEDHYEITLNKKIKTIENIFKNWLSNLNINNSKNLNLIEYTILNFVSIYNGIYSVYSISTILKGAHSEYLSDKIKKSVYYGILKNLYSRQNIRSAIYNLIHEKRLLEEVAKQCSPKYGDKKNYTVIRLADISEEFSKEVQSVNELIVQSLKKG